MDTNLRPLTLGEILDRTAQLYRTNFLLFAGIYAIYAGVLLVLNLVQIGLTSWLTGQHMAIWLQVLTVSGLLIKGLFVFLFAGAAMAAINRAVAWVYMGEPATIRGAYASTLPHLGRYLWLMVIVAFMIGAHFLVLEVGFFALPGILKSAHVLDPSSPAGALALGLTIVLWIAYATWMLLRYSLAVPASVVENLKARKSLRRSIELSKGSRGRILLLWLLVLIIELGLVLLSQLFFFVAAYKQHNQVGPVILSVSQIVAFFTNTFIGPIYATGLALFYYDQRVRKEGYDIEWMMQAAGLTPEHHEKQDAETLPEAAPATGTEPPQGGEAA